MDDMMIVPRDLLQRAYDALEEIPDCFDIVTMKLLVLVAALALAGCCDCPPPPGDPIAGGINCTLDARNCEPGQKR